MKKPWIKIVKDAYKKAKNRFYVYKFRSGILKKTIV